MGPTMLHCCLSTVTLYRQTKPWLQKRSFLLFVVLAGHHRFSYILGREGDAKGVYLVAICKTTKSYTLHF